MKRIATLALAGAITLVTGGSVASAGTDDYPPEDDVVLLLSASVVAPGAAFSATLEGCTDGETVDFTVEGDADSATCINGSATVTLTAPSAEGTYTVSAVGRSSGVSDTSELVVDAEDDGDVGDLPETGSSAGTIAQVSAALIVGGLGLVGVARLRRRRPVGI